MRLMRLGVPGALCRGGALLDRGPAVRDRCPYENKPSGHTLISPPPKPIEIVTNNFNDKSLRAPPPRMRTSVGVPRAVP